MGKKKTIDDRKSKFAAIAAKTGGALFSDGGAIKYLIDTGSLALNYMVSGKFIGGGIAGGKITEIFGPESSAKSLVSYSLLGSVQRIGGIPVYLDCEFAGNAEFAEKCGHLNPEELFTYYPETYERVSAKIIASVNEIREMFGADAPILVVWDSIGVTMTERELKEIDLPENASKAAIKAAGGNEKPGERAKAAGKILRKLNPFLDAHNATLVVINQTRANIGVMYGEKDVTAGGGRALRYYASCRLAFASSKKIKDEKKDIVVGVNLIMRNRKNRHFPPHRETKGVQLFFDQGINPLGGMLSILIGAGRIEKGSKATMYKVMEPWADGKDYEFKGSIEKNDVPMDLLLTCPKIVDAKDEAEVREYMATYASAVDISGSDALKEEATNEEELLDDILEVEGDEED